MGDLLGKLAAPQGSAEKLITRCEIALIQINGTKQVL
jgi:hypothetical protein